VLSEESVVNVYMGAGTKETRNEKKQVGGHDRKRCPQRGGGTEKNCSKPRVKKRR